VVQWCQVQTEGTKDNADDGFESVYSRSIGEVSLQPPCDCIKQSQKMLTNTRETTAVDVSVASSRALMAVL
jgi:hypothetical protein